MAAREKKKRSLAISAASSETVTILQEGQVLSGRYRVIERIGVGGMGVVYRVEDSKWDNRPFALKALPPDMAKSEAAIKRLKREADSAIELHHPNIMALHSFDNDGPHHFLVMELLDGPDLENALAEKEKFSVEEVLNIARQICSALDYAHKKGIVHRDIKPGNILFTTEGDEQVVKIADFGIAYQVRNSIAKITGQDISGGTLHYMPPEQLAGREVDSRADQYALAASLYELLRGRPPFEGAGAILMRQIDENEPEAIDNVPEHMNSALLKALAKKPEDRFDTCESFFAVLDGTKTLERDKTEKPKGSLKTALMIVCLLLCVFGAWEYETGSFGFYTNTVTPTKTVSPQPTQLPPTPPTPPTPSSTTKIKVVDILPTPTITPRATVAETPTPSVEPKVATTAPELPVAEPNVVREFDVLFSSEPKGAKVYCFQTLTAWIGRTSEPFKKKFKAGKYQFKFANLQGYREKVLPFEVKDDEKNVVHAVLEREQGSVVVNANPSDALVTVNGLPYRGAPITLPPGKYTVSVSKSGYYAKSEEILVQDGKTRLVDLVLQAKPRGPKPGAEKTVAGFRFCWCPPGLFLMGNDEVEIKIEKGFWLGKFEVTQSQWQAVMSDNPATFKGPDRPIETITFEDCKRFIGKLNEANHTNEFAIPRAAQWEYACKAGTKGERYGVLDNIAWFKENSGGETHSIGQKRANAWGLYDMLGNVSEFCSLFSSGEDEHADAGGTYAHEAKFCRATYRRSLYSSARGNGIGLRLLLRK